MQVKSIMKPNSIGPGIEPNALIKSHCTPIPNERMLAGTTLKKKIKYVIEHSKCAFKIYAHTQMWLAVVL